MTWHYHDDDVAGPDALIEMQLTGVNLNNGDATVRHYRIDQDHSNAFTAWKKLGSPQQPTPEQYAQLEKASRLTLLNEGATRVENSRTTIRFELPRQAVSLIELTW
jgi:xylan 1,4-beta-xylosidase